MEEKIRELIENRIRPALQQDGGDIDFVELDGKAVKVKLRGACDGCPMATMTLQMGVLRVLQQELPEIEAVVPV
ncbi:MAG: NifU family protein [Polyangia bacterium]